MFFCHSRIHSRIPSTSPLLFSFQLNLKKICRLLLFKFIYLFLVTVGLHCCAQALHTLLFVAVHGLLIAVASLLQSTGSTHTGFSYFNILAQWLWYMGLVG